MADILQTFSHIFFSKNVWNLIEIALKCVPKNPVDDNPAIVQLMAWHRTDDELLPESLVVTRLQ